jgi:hypothetical protein
MQLSDACLGLRKDNQIDDQAGDQKQLLLEEKVFL